MILTWVFFSAIYAIYVISALYHCLAIQRLLKDQPAMAIEQLGIAKRQYTRAVFVTIVAFAITIFVWSKTYPWYVLYMYLMVGCATLMNVLIYSWHTSRLRLVTIPEVRDDPD